MSVFLGQKVMLLPKNQATGAETPPDGDGQVVTEDRVQVQRPRRFGVILLNDDFTPMEFVVWLIQQVFRKSAEESSQLMLEVHQKGQALCGVYPYDIARTKVYQVQSLAQQHKHPLECVLEPMEDRP